MKQKILTFDGRNLKTERIDAPGRLRWTSWSRHEVDSIIAVGDRGTIVTRTRGNWNQIQTRTHENLRCVEFSPKSHEAYICGNDGTILVKRLTEAHSIPGNDARGSLRRLGWSHAGDDALFVGNDGAAYSIAHGGHARRLQGAETNLRSVAWHPRDDYALVCGNCFMASIGGLSPSPNLFIYRKGADSLAVLVEMAESRADLTAASWRPDGGSCLMVGFDQTWHTASALSYRNGRPRELSWGAKETFPTACAWHPSGEYALVGTSPMKVGEGECTIYRYEEGGGFEKLLDLGDYGVSCIAWSPDGTRAIINGSRSVKAFSA